MSNTTPFPSFHDDTELLVERVTDFILELLKKDNRNIAEEKDNFQTLHQIKYFILELVSTRVCDFPTLLVALMYLDKLVKTDKIDLSNFEDLTLLCTVLSSKMWEEMFWSNQDYLVVLQNPMNLEKFNQMEKHILEVLNWNLYISKVDYCKFVDNLCK